MAPKIMMVGTSSTNNSGPLPSAFKTYGNVFAAWKYESNQSLPLTLM